jgi:hypothetical protein
VTLPKLEARTDAGGDTDEDGDVRHGVQDHIDIDAERCRGFGGGHEDGRRHAREYSVLAIDTHSPVDFEGTRWAGWPAQRSRSAIDMYCGLGRAGVSGFRDVVGWMGGGDRRRFFVVAGTTWSGMGGEQGERKEKKRRRDTRARVLSRVLTYLRGTFPSRCRI